MSVLMLKRAAKADPKQLGPRPSKELEALAEATGTSNKIDVEITGHTFTRDNILESGHRFNTYTRSLDGPGKMVIHHCC